MCRDGKPALIGAVGWLADRAVRETVNGPKFVLWTPFPGLDEDAEAASDARQGILEPERQKPVWWGSQSGSTLKRPKLPPASSRRAPARRRHGEPCGRPTGARSNRPVLAPAPASALPPAPAAARPRG
jgi:hypothetical protein